jgi:hypothetical protein
VGFEDGVGDLEVRRDLDFRDLEYREDLEDREGLEVVTDVGFRDSLCVESKGDSTVLDGQSIWGLTRSSQGIPRMIE